jgi:hypothetical protein
MTYAKESILDLHRTCRGQDAPKIWDAIMVGTWTVGDVAVAISRGVRYAHSLLKELESEGRVALVDAKRVRDKAVIVLTPTRS